MRLSVMWPCTPPAASGSKRVKFRESRLLT